MAKKQEELVAPIHDKIYEAVKQLAQRNNYDVVFDRASAEGTMIFASPRIDISDQVLARLGYSK